jgi:hypothetical protein
MLFMEGESPMRNAQERAAIGARVRAETDAIAERIFAAMALRRYAREIQPNMFRAKEA